MNGYRRLSPADRRAVGAWTVAGTLASLAIAHTVDRILFRHMNDEARMLGDMEAMLLSFGVAGPVLFIALVKLANLAAVNRNLRQLVATDALTGVLSRGAFMKKIEDWLQEAPEAKGALLIADADNFKMINDGFGHDQGDLALRAIAEALGAALRSGDLLGRLGGEEFGIFLPGADAGNAGDVAERLRRSVAEREFVPSGQRYALSVSIGVAAFECPADYAEIFKLADERMYAAKQAGRNHIELATMGETAARPIPSVMLH